MNNSIYFLVKTLNFKGINTPRQKIKSLRNQNKNP